MNQPGQEEILNEPSASGERRGRWQILAERLFLGACWIPLATFVAVEWNIRHSEGWGAWGAASALVLPVMLSAVLGPIGLVLLWFASRRGRRPLGLLLATLLAASVGIWFLFRIWSR